jgi:hypothetical protein
VVGPGALFGRHTNADPDAHAFSYSYANSQSFSYADSSTYTHANTWQWNLRSAVADRDLDYCGRDTFF